MKLTLGLCTIGNFLKVSIYNDKKFFVFSKKYLNQEEILFKVINRLVLKTGGSFQDIQNICYINGPGRFTGMRISYTFANIYKVLSGAKIYCATAFDCLAYNLYERLKNENNIDIAVILRAFKDEFYLCYYKIWRGNIKKVSPYFWLKDYDLLKKLSNFSGYLIGDKEEYSDIYKFAGKNSIVCDDSISLIKSENIIRSALYFKNPDKKPLYLKPAKYEVPV